MKTFTKYTFFLYAFLLPFGSINIFTLSVSQEIIEKNTDQQGFTPYIFALCIIMAFLDKRVRGQIYQTTVFFLPLIIIYLCFLLPTLYYETNLPFPLLFLMKLLIAEAGFVLIAQYYINYPKLLNMALSIYAYTCVLIVTAFFIGLLDGLYFVSQGRLWLFGENPNIYSFMMGLGALILIYDINYKKLSKWIIVFNIISVIAIIFYIILSGSRGSSLIVVFCIFCISYKKMVQHLFISSIIILFTIYLITMFIYNHNNDISLFERFIELQDGRDNDRSNLLKDAFSLYTERPILGFGYNGYIEQRLLRFHDNRDSHNLLLSTAVMSGTIGLVSMLSFLYILCRKSIIVVKQINMAIVIFIYVLLMSMKTGDVITFSMMWYCYALVLAMSVHGQQQYKQITK